MSGNNVTWDKICSWTRKKNCRDQNEIYTILYRPIGGFDQIKKSRKKRNFEMINKQGEAHREEAGTGVRREKKGLW